jgi:hypothetical protein
MRILAALMDFSQTAPLFVLSFQFLILHLLISILRHTAVHKIGAFTNTVAMLVHTTNTNYIETSSALYITLNTHQMFKIICLFILSDEHHYIDVVYLMFC